MNPIVYVHLLVGCVTIALALPLAKGRVPMNRWYGIRTRAAFASPQAWRAINRYAGRLLCVWGGSMCALAVAGVFVRRPAWVAYDWVSLVLIIAGFIWMMTQVAAFSRRYRPPG